MRNKNQTEHLERITILEPENQSIGTFQEVKKTSIGN